MWFFRKGKPLRSLPEISESEKIVLLQWEGLSRREDAIQRIFFRKDGKRRILILNRADGFLTYCRERLTIADEAEREIFSEYGFWEPDGGGGIYDSEERLLRDLKAELADYEEEPFRKNHRTGENHA